MVHIKVITGVDTDSSGSILTSVLTMTHSQVTLPKVPLKIKSTNTKQEILSSYRVLEHDLNEIQEQQLVLFVVVGLLIVLIVI